MTESSNTDSRDDEPDGTYTDEQAKGEATTDEHGVNHSEAGSYTDSELSETEKDRTERHD